MTLSEAAKETIYLRSFLQELGLCDLTDVVVFNDNLGAKKLADNLMYHSRSKHIDLKHHFMRYIIFRTAADRIHSYKGHDRRCDGQDPAQNTSDVSERSD